MAEEAKRIVLTFEWDGKTVHKETFGFVGQACAEETKFVENALRGSKGLRKFKAEAVRAAKHKVSNTIKA
jgi:hypothetical protein